MYFVLAEHLEGLSDACAAHFEFKVLLFAVEAALDKAAEFYAVFNPDALFVVNFHHDAVVGADGEVGQEIVFTGEPFVDDASHYVYVGHVS